MIVCDCGMIVCDCDCVKSCAFVRMCVCVLSRGESDRQSGRLEVIVPDRDSFWSRLSTRLMHLIMHLSTNSANAAAAAAAAVTATAAATAANTMPDVFDNKHNRLTGLVCCSSVLRASARRWRQQQHRGWRSGQSWCCHHVV